MIVKRDPEEFTILRLALLTAFLAWKIRWVVALNEDNTKVDDG